MVNQIPVLLNQDLYILHLIDKKVQVFYILINDILVIRCYRASDPLVEI